MRSERMTQQVPKTQRCIILSKAKNLSLISPPTTHYATLRRPLLITHYSLFITH